MTTGTDVLMTVARLHLFRVAFRSEAQPCVSTDQKQSDGNILVSDLDRFTNGVQGNANNKQY